MAQGKLVIGTRRYSSWSLRGWLAVRLARLDVEEVVIPLDESGRTAGIKQASPTGLVPFLEHDGARVWESLALIEYCAEVAPSLWPPDRVARAHARSIATEMHGGFGELRRAMPMNLGRVPAGVREVPEAVRADIARIEAIWAEARRLYGASGPYLYGAAFGGADVMYAPVVARFLGYAPALSEGSRDYCAAVRAHPLVAEWYDAAAGEPAAWRLRKYEEIA